MEHVLGWKDSHCEINHVKPDGRINRDTGLRQEIILFSLVSRLFELPALPKVGQELIIKQVPPGRPIMTSMAANIILMLDAMV